MNLLLGGSVLGPVVSGIVRVENTVGAPPSVFGTGGGTPVALPINPRFDVSVVVGKNVRVNNPQLNARVEGNLTIKGPLLVNGQSGADLKGANPADIHLGVQVLGKLTIPEGRLTLPTARFTILPPGTVTVTYPVANPAGGNPTLGVDIDVRARTRLSATSLAGTRKLYTITVAARGPVTGITTDPTTGDSRLSLFFTSDPNDLATSQQALAQRLAGVLGGDALGQFGRNPGQVIAQQLTNVFTESVIPGLFDNVARATGFDELELAYDPIQRLNLVVSRQIFGPFYVSYNRTLGTIPEMYTLKMSYRIRRGYQVSFEQNELNEQRTLLEGVWRF